MIKSLLRTYRFIASHPLTEKNRVAAMTRWLRWQMVSRLRRGPVIFPWIGGACLVVERGMTGATGNIYCGLHEFEDMALLLHYFGPRQAGMASRGLFLDVGANVGSYTILAGRVCGVECISLEPVPATFERLTRNVRANQIESLVDARCLGAGRDSCTLRFTCDCDTTNRTVDVDYAGPALELPVQPLDHLLGGRQPDFWKVDVEGFEKEVLAGATESLHRPTLEIVLLEAEDAEIHSLMRRSGFQEARYEPFTRTMTPAENQRASSNHLWVRDLKVVQNRCRSAGQIQVLGVSL